MQTRRGRGICTASGRHALHPVPDRFVAALAKFEISPQWLAAAAAEPTAARLPVPLWELVADSADPAMALANWERMAARPDAGAVIQCSGEELRGLFAVLGGSQTLSTTLLGESGDWLALLRHSLRGGATSAAAHAANLAPRVSEPWAEFENALRRYRQREYLRIGACDLTRRYQVDDTVRELSALADGCFEAAYQRARGAMESAYGMLLLDGAPQPFVVLGMGKLGGQELNYSSDVDVVYLFAEDRGESAGGAKGRLGAREYCTRLAESITRAMQEITEGGFVFRVDLRLRPDGINGPMVNPLQNALLYYESWGQTWERTALIKARPIAGDRSLGEQFCAEVRPFIYRRYLDFTTVAEMQEMKGRVGRQSGGKPGDDNIKLGSGGIREIEFVVQVLQLIFGGRDERLRVRGTLAVLARLADAGHLARDDAAALAAAYRFLRDVEHKIQLVHERQTQTLPSGAPAQLGLARRLGFRGDGAAEEFARLLHGHRDVVRQAFSQLFREPREQMRRQAEPEATVLMRELDAKEASLERLRGLGFENPEARYEDLLMLRDGGAVGRRSPRRLRALEALAPSLISLVRRSVAPDRALRNFATFVGAVGARTSLLALLEERSATLAMLVNVFAGSELLTTAFTRRPELLDTLVGVGGGPIERTREDMAATLKDALSAAADYEEELDALRRFRHEEFVRVAINDLHNALDVAGVSGQLTLLADTCLTAALSIAERVMCERYGLAALPGRIAVLALGKLGSRELNYHSDLDLIFVYDSEAPNAHELFSRLLQRLLGILQVPTREGYVYKTDTRLRPSGSAGPLVSSLAAFEQYHAESARVWERQALIRARAVAGSAGLCRDLEGVVEGFVFRDSLPPAGVREIRHLRGRMERELAREQPGARNIKTGRGALIDVEFLVQMLQLVHGHRLSAVRCRNVRDALEALHACGILPDDDAELLRAGHAFLRRLDGRLRIAVDQAVETMRRASPALETVARHLGFDGADPAAELWHAYEQQSEAIRGCFDRWFDREGNVN